MARIKYYYDTETCKYERIRVSRWDIFLNFMGFFALSLILAIGLTFVYSNFFELPQVSMLKKENKELLTYYQMLEKDMNEITAMMGALQDRDDNVYRVIFEADPIPSTIREAGVGGVDRYKDLFESNSRQEVLIHNTLEKADKLKKQMYIQTKSYDEILEMAGRKNEMLASIPSIQPISNKELTRLASGFGMRMHPILKIRRFHQGIDFSAPTGTPVYATGNGKVITVQTTFTGLGKHVIIDHGYGFETRYGHLNDFNVKAGQEVKRGEVIGFVGNTGWSTAPHLHYEVWKSGKPLNPVFYFYNDIIDEEWDKLLELASRENQSLGGN
ncbi:MAG: M23 family metallopeptidase [Cyclobacteriaceae bacterium]|nr:M23 family metallopeptidase [Cyclobacteriaceae bacterium]